MRAVWGWATVEVRGKSWPSWGVREWSGWVWAGRLLRMKGHGTETRVPIILGAIDGFSWAWEMGIRVWDCTCTNLMVVTSANGNICCY